jgi:hypothetical protein
VTGKLVAALIAGSVALVLLVGGQLLLPSLGEGDVEERLTERGGVAEASLDAVPALRLLWGDGDRIEVTGSGLDLDLTQEPQVFDRLDGFSEVEIGLDEFRAGPFEIDSFDLRRDGDGPYAVRSSSTVSTADLVEFGADALGVPGVSIMDFFLDRTPGSDRPLPVELDMEMESDDGRVRVVSGGGTIAGVPTGPLAQLITAAIVVRL